MFIVKGFGQAGNMIYCCSHIVGWLVALERMEQYSTAACCVDLVATGTDREGQHFERITRDCRGKWEHVA